MERALAIGTEIDRGQFKQHSKSAKGLGISQYLENTLLSFDSLRPKTVASYRNRIRQLVTFLREKHPQLLFVSDFSPEIAREYVVWRQQRDVTRCGWMKPSTPTSKPHSQTVRDDVSRLKKLFRPAVANGWFPKNPFDGISIQRKTTEKLSAHNPLSRKQIGALLQAANLYDKAKLKEGGQSTFKGMIRDITELFLLTGLRKEELIYLPWQNVDLEWGDFGLIHIKAFTVAVELQIKIAENRLESMKEISEGRAAHELLFSSERKMRSVVPANYADQQTGALMALECEAWDSQKETLRVNTTVRWEQKTRPGDVPLNEKSREIINRRRKANKNASPFVFSHPDGGPLRSDYWAEFKKLLAAAGLPSQFRVHDLRHTFGFRLRELDVRLETIMGLMRHANIEETMIYAQYSNEEGAKRIQALDVFTE